VSILPSQQQKLCWDYFAILFCLWWQSRHCH